MKKVLFFIDSLGHGGAEKVLTNLVRHLDRTKYDITLMTLFDIGVNKKYLPDDVKYKYVFRKVFRGNVFLFKLLPRKLLYKLIIKDKYDVLIAYLEGNTTRIISGCDNDAIKKIAWIHIEMSNEGFKRLFRSRKDCISIYKSYDKIIGVSETVLESFRNNIKYALENTEVKYNTVEDKYIKACGEEEVTDIIFDKNYTNIISVGRLIEQKSYKRLIEVVNRLILAGNKIRLYILGDGNQRKVLQNYIDVNNLNNHIYLLGFKDNPWKYVSKADLFVCSSWKEGFSTAVTESLILGTPVITTMCSGMVEMLGKNEYGIIVDNDIESLYKGMEKIINDKELLKYYRKKAEERGKYFSMEQTVKEVEKLIDEV